MEKRDVHMRYVIKNHTATRVGFREGLLAGRNGEDGLDYLEPDEYIYGCVDCEVNRKDNDCGFQK